MVAFFGAGGPAAYWTLNRNRGIRLAGRNAGCRAMGKGLYEVRVPLKDRIARLLFLVDGDDMVVLHGFIKKSQATPQPDLALARKRQQIWENER